MNNVSSVASNTLSPDNRRAGPYKNRWKTPKFTNANVNGDAQAFIDSDGRPRRQAIFLTPEEVAVRQSACIDKMFAYQRVLSTMNPLLVTMRKRTNHLKQGIDPQSLNYASTFEDECIEAQSPLADPTLPWPPTAARVTDVLARTLAKLFEEFYTASEATERALETQLSRRRHPNWKKKSDELVGREDHKTIGGILLGQPRSYAVVAAALQGYPLLEDQRPSGLVRQGTPIYVGIKKEVPSNYISDVARGYLADSELRELARSEVMEHIAAYSGISDWSTLQEIENKVSNEIPIPWYMPSYPEPYATATSSDLPNPECIPQVFDSVESENWFQATRAFLTWADTVINDKAI